MSSWVGIVTYHVSTTRHLGLDDFHVRTTLVAACGVGSGRRIVSSYTHWPVYQIYLYALCGSTIKFPPPSYRIYLAKFAGAAEGGPSGVT